MWYGVDFDKTLADEDGQPIQDMVDRVEEALTKGLDVRIFTARDPKDDAEIKNFCREHFGRELPITDTKDYEMEEIWDDKAVNPGDTMLQGIGHLAGVMKQHVAKMGGTSPGTSSAKKTKKSRFLGAIQKFSQGVKKGSYSERYGS